MTDITKKLGHGKGLEQLLDAVADISLLTPKLWSNIRFAAHAAKTFAAFRVNWLTMGAVLPARGKGAKGAAAAQKSCGEKSTSWKISSVTHKLYHLSSTNMYLTLWHIPYAVFIVYLMDN